MAAAPDSATSQTAPPPAAAGDPRSLPRFLRVGATSGWPVPRDFRRPPRCCSPSLGCWPFARRCSWGSLPRRRAATTAQEMTSAPKRHEERGPTARMHTFFRDGRQLFVGDYFKAEAIAWPGSFTSCSASFRPGCDEQCSVGRRRSRGELADAVGSPSGSCASMGDNFWVSGPLRPAVPCSELYGTSFKPNWAIDGNRRLRTTARFISSTPRVHGIQPGMPLGVLRRSANRNIGTGWTRAALAQILQHSAEQTTKTDLILPADRKRRWLAVPYLSRSLITKGSDVVEGGRRPQPSPTADPAMGECLEPGPGLHSCGGLLRRVFVATAAVIGIESALSSTANGERRSA